MTKATQRELKRITDTIVRAYKPEKIILFGSYAWGKPHPESDVDLFVVKKTTVPSLKRIEALDRLFQRRELPMDFLVYTPSQLQRRVELGDFFVEEIVTKGKVLYERPRSRIRR